MSYNYEQEIAYNMRRFIKETMNKMAEEYFEDEYYMIMDPYEMLTIIKTFKEEAYEHFNNNFDKIVEEYRFQKSMEPLMRSISRGLKL